MASILKHLRSSTADKRPVASGLADGQIAINTASGTPAMFFKDSNGDVVKVGPAHVGNTAPNAVPAGSAGNSLGELWVDNSLTTAGLKYYTGSTFVNLTPSGTETTVGLVELATAAETQTGTDAIRAITPSGLQSKVSDSTSTTSSTTIASSTAVKAAYDLANAALPKAGGTVTGELLIGNTGSLVFEGATDNTLETTIAVTDPTADRTITFPDVSGTVVTTGDTGSVTSTMILDGTIVNADINASAAIIYSKLALSSGIVNTDISASAAIAYSKLAALNSGNILVGDGSNIATSVAMTGDIAISNAGVTAIASGVIINTDVNASAAIAGTKISPDFGSQNITTTGTNTAASFIPTSSGIPTNGMYLPATNSVAISTNSVERVKLGTSEVVFNDDGVNYDFRIEGDTNSSLFFVDASADKIGIGTTSPATALNVQASAGELFRATVSSNTSLYANIGADGNGGWFGSNTDLRLMPSGTERARIDSSGRLLVGTSTASNSNARAIIQGNSDDAAGAGAFDIKLGTTRPTAADAGIGLIRFGTTSQTSASNVYAQITCSTDGASSSDSDIPGRLVFSTTADGASSPTERLKINRNGTLFSVPTYNNTAAISANVFVDSDGSIGRSTSSSKYKTSVETIEDQYSDALLNCRPVWYRSTCKTDNPNYGWWGFIAEEVAEIDPRLVHWKTTEPVVQENGSLEHVPCDPEPEGVAYDRFVPHLLNLIKRQSEAIAELQAEVATLKAS